MLVSCTTALIKTMCISQSLLCLDRTTESLYDGFCAGEHEMDVMAEKQFCQCQDGKDPVCGNNLDIFTCGIQKTSSRNINLGQLINLIK